jgi:antitoxin PrlF
MAGTYRSRVSSKGQLVIPAELRKRCGFSAGTEVTLTEENGRLFIESHSLEDLLSLRGSLKGHSEIEELMNEEREKEKQRMERLERIR